jgi:hypothetical protein
MERRTDLEKIIIDVLNRYQQLGSKFLRKDKHGAISVNTDGEIIELGTFPDKRNSHSYAISAQNEMNTLTILMPNDMLNEKGV